MIELPASAHVSSATPSRSAREPGSGGSALPAQGRGSLPEEPRAPPRTRARSSPPRSRCAASSSGASSGCTDIAAADHRHLQRRRHFRDRAPSPACRRSPAHAARQWMATAAAPASCIRRAKSQRSHRRAAVSPARIFTVTGTVDASTAAAVSATALGLGHQRHARPLRRTFGTEQPMLMSMMSAPAATAAGTASRMIAGSAPKSWIGHRVLALEGAPASAASARSPARWR
jgi:hypothetical protein